MPTLPGTNIIVPVLDGSLNTWGTELNGTFEDYEAFWAPSGALSIAGGGTGAADAATARSGLGTGTVATQDASGISAGTIITSGVFGIKTPSPSADCEVTGQLSAASGIFSSTFSGGSASLGSAVFGSTLQVDSALKASTFLGGITDPSGGKLIKTTRLKNTANKTISASGAYDVPWDAEEVDELSAWSSGSSFALPAGRYLIACCFQLVFSVNDSPGHNSYLYNLTDSVLIGMNEQRFDSNWGSDVKINGLTEIKIASTKTFAIRLYQYSSASVTLKAVSAVFPPSLIVIKTE